MSPEKMVGADDSDGKWLYRVGGISALVLGVAYLIIFPLYAHVGVPPIGGGGEAWFEYLAGKTTIWWVILGLSVLTDLLFIPVALSLYLALRRTNRDAMLIATAFVGLFVALDLAVTWSNYASLLTLSEKSLTANEVQRAAYVAAADYASAVLSSRLEIVYAIVVLSGAIFIMAVVMLKGVFSRTTACLGIATGILGMAAVTGTGLVIVMNAVFATIWLFFVGHGLYRLSRP